MATFDPNAAAQPGSGVFGLPHSASEAALVLVPVPFEATCSYGGGTSRGPAAILQASRQVDLYDPDTGTPYEAGIHMLPVDARVATWSQQGRQLAEQVIAKGGVTEGDEDAARTAAHVNAYCEQMCGWVDSEVGRWLEAGKRVGTVGGDHSISLGAIRAHARRFPGLGILHVDAHADLRLAYEGFRYSHASIMRNVIDTVSAVTRVVQVGIRDFCQEEAEVAAGSGGRVIMHTDGALQGLLHEGQAWANLCQRVVDPLPQRVYVSFDIDGLEPSLCPHTGTPVPGGLSYPHALTLLKVLCRSGRELVGFDLTEVTPGPEGDEWDANVGARLLYKLSGWTLHSQRG